MGKIIDARGLTCPQPVILTKRAMDQGDKDELVTIVDNDAALENVSKLGKSQGYDVNVEEQDQTYYIRMNKTSCETIPQQNFGADVAILVTSQFFGQGNEELGQVLMKSFLYSLNEMKEKIKHIIFMNSGIFLTCEGSPVLEYLQGLESDGVEVLSCGTCLDFYGMKEKLATGKVTNMYTAMDILTTASKSITL
ncbi:MAG TPA: sulfurtransferase-like selenium metabolism protein YedF [Syntrophomonadaceae bacterium]|nr:sulfurtransferase-like selenium metabolism protein YedF [Syntrophomonadaceae bacterium]